MISAKNQQETKRTFNKPESRLFLLFTFLITVIVGCQNNQGAKEAAGYVSGEAAEEAVAEEYQQEIPVVTSPPDSLGLDAFYKKYGVKLTYTPVIVLAAIHALKKYPGINISVSGNYIIQKKYINIGVATALPDGNLIVPVIKDADKKNLSSLASSLADLAGRARSGNLSPNEIRGGTFTITNMGQYENISGTPIINQPEVAILAVGAIKKKPGVVRIHNELTIGIRDIMVLSLTYDHRVVDGALGGSFVREIGHYLETILPEF